jgi:hypothetical protein
MLQKSHLTFNGNTVVITEKQLFTNIQNTFTIEFWSKPGGTHGIDKESREGLSGTSNKRYVITPVHGAFRDGDSSRAGVGISVGTNGVSVYEHTTGYIPAVLVYITTLEDWNHIAVVYVNKTPFLYINGQFVRKGLRSKKNAVVPSGVLGGLDFM